MEDERIEEATAAEIASELAKRNPEDESINLLRDGLLYVPEDELDRRVLENRARSYDYEDERSY